MNHSTSVTLSPDSVGRSQRDSLLTWQWPPCPCSLTVYDKYADVSHTMMLSESMWPIPVQGRVERFHFANGGAGTLQRSMVMLTQADSAPSTVTKFTRSVINRWDIYVELLESGPMHARDLWDKHVLDVDTAKAGKTLLKLICKLGLGYWSVLHTDFVGALDTRAKKGLLAQRGKVKRREKLVAVSTQADVVRVLDETAASSELLEEHIEGLSALALIFQHGMRPVQLLALRLEHVPAAVPDASGDPTLVVSFHSGKRHDGKVIEMVRQVKPEWVPLVNTLRLSAVHAGRTRLFSCTSNDQIWAKVKTSCAAYGLNIDFRAYGLRHTSMQNLADAGHDRKSIQTFAGHNNVNAATSYMRASRQQGEMVNKALGTSKLYEGIIAFSKDTFITVEQVMAADEDQQIGGIVGGKLIAGIGLCKTGQKNCAFNPVTSCYGCRRYAPAINSPMHQEAIGGMRAQVQVYLADGMAERSSAFKQLTTALSVAQQAFEMSKTLEAPTND